MASVVPAKRDGVPVVHALKKLCGDPRHEPALVSPAPQHLGRSPIIARPPRSSLMFRALLRSEPGCASPDYGEPPEQQRHGRCRISPHPW